VQSIERGLAEGKELIDNECLEERLPQEFNRSRFDSTVNSNYDQSLTDNQQHQAYRSLLQSTSSTSYQGISEQQPSVVTEIKGWRFLSRLSVEFCLLENNQRLILLNVPLLLKKIKYQKLEQLSAAIEGDETKRQKLLFPELINCSTVSEAKSIAESLITLNVINSVSEKQITILEVPFWLESFPIREICLELYLIESQEVVNTHILSAERTILVLDLILTCNDLSKLGLKELPFSDLPELFNQEFETHE
jgi:DNA mismatch repair ATPase MutL